MNKQNDKEKQLEKMNRFVVMFGGFEGMNGRWGRKQRVQQKKVICIAVVDFCTRKLETFSTTASKYLFLFTKFLF